MMRNVDGMRSSRSRGRRKFPIFLLSISLLVLTCLLAACGSKASSGSVGGTGGSPVNPSPTVVKGYGSSQGCPTDYVVTNPPSAANVQVKINDRNTTINAHVGDVIEIRLPFGQKWTGPSTSQSGLELQQPYGYALKSANVCVWRFTAKSAGTTSLHFQSQAICKPGQMCPMYIAEFPFTISVK